MHIALIVPGFSADASDWCIPALRHFAAELAGHARLRILTLRYPHRRGRYPLVGAEVLALGGATRRGLGSAVLWRAALATLAAEHRQQPFDLLHAFWATESGALAGIAGRMLRLPVVVSLAGGELTALHNGYGDQLARSNQLKVQLALRLAEAVTAGSQYMATLAQPFLQRSRHPHPCQRLPLGVDLELFQPGALAQATLQPRLVQAASLTPVKDQATLLRAVALLHTRRVPFQLDIAGSGPLEGELRALATHLGIARQVEFCGALPHDQLPAFFRGAAAFVLSSQHEAQCMALLEAAACGVPAVGAAVGVLPELAPAAAMAVPANDPAALASALEALLRDPLRQQALGAVAAARVRHEFGVAACVTRARALYAECMG